MRDKLDEKRSERDYIKDQINCSLFAGNKQRFLELTEDEKKVNKEIRVLERRVKFSQRIRKRLGGIKK
jgi:acetone carboxylase gamma subunit